MRETLLHTYGELTTAWNDGLRGEAKRSSIAFGILAVLAFAACLLSSDLMDLLTGLMSQLTADLDLLTEGGRLSASALFASNLQAMAFIMFYGLLPFLQLPAMALGLNAVMLGWLAAWYVRSGQSLLLYLAALAPHAIFELPALALAFGTGLYLCGQLTRRLRGDKEGTLSFLHCLSLLSQTLLLALAPLLLIAALVEAYVTPLVAAWFL